MPFARPTLRQLIDRFKADIRTYTDGGDALLRRSVERVLSRAVPGLAHGLYGNLAWIARQIFPATGDDESVTTWAAMLGVTPRPAAPAVGAAQFSVTGTPTIPAGHLVQRSDGVRYVVTAEVVASGSPVEVELEAEEPGAVGNCDTATPVVLVSPIAGVSSSGVISDPEGMHDGVDVENVEQLRVRVLERLKNPPRGGSRGDYIAWALEVPGVTRVWETPRVEGAGTVGVQFVTDDPVEPFGSPIPSDQARDDVEALLVDRAPVTIGRSIEGVWVGVVVTKPTPLPLAIEIADLETEDGADLDEVKQAIRLEIVDFLRREARPGKADGSVILRRSRLDEAISAAAGEESHRLVSPAADIVLAAGALPIYDNVGSPIVWS